MKYKNYLMLRFLPVAFTNFGQLLKNLFHFTEEHNSRLRVKKKGFDKGLPVVDILEILPDLNDTVYPFTFLDDTSMISDLLLIKGVAKKFTNCDYLEIGSWRGESLMNIVDHVNTCISVSLSPEQMIQKGFLKKQAELCHFFSKNNPKIIRIGADSQTFDFSSLGKKFDLIYVDGDHHYDSVMNDTRNAFKLLKNENSIIVWNDYGISYETVRWEVLDAILDSTPSEKKSFLYKVSNTFCAIYINKKLPSKITEFPATPNKIFTVNVKASRL